MGKISTLMNISWLFFLPFLFSTASSNDKAKVQLDQLIDTWHSDAATGNFDRYFSVTAEDFVFLGTDPTERWTKQQFMDFCKPHFADGSGWDFKKLERNWMFSSDGKTAWFDERLDTWMKDCRGSGICIKKGKTWKLAYYNLTVLIENEKVKEFILLREQK